MIGIAVVLIVVGERVGSSTAQSNRIADVFLDYNMPPVEFECTVAVAVVVIDAAVADSCIVLICSHCVCCVAVGDNIVVAAVVVVLPSL